MEENEQCKEVYANYGLAMYCAQCLEIGMVHSIVFFDHFPKAVPNYTDQKKWFSDFNEYFGRECEKTMGRLLKKLKTMGVPIGNLETDLEKALKNRNFLAHEYFYERAMEFMSEEGRFKMISELENIRDDFSRITENLKVINLQAAAKHGITEEVLKKIMNGMMVEANADLYP